MDISSVEQYIGYTVASQLMKESLYSKAFGNSSINAYNKE